MGRKWGAGDVGGWKGVPVARKEVSVNPKGARWVENACQWLGTRGWVSKTGAGGSRRVAGARKGVLLHLNGACWVANWCWWLETGSGVLKGVVVGRNAAWASKYVASSVATT